MSFFHIILDEGPSGLGWAFTKAWNDWVPLHHPGLISQSDINGY